MKIITATDDFFPSVKSLFKDFGETSVIKKEDTEADLLVFTGGEDINPSCYTTPTVQSSRLWYNDKRDAFELKLVRAVLTKKFKAKKVLGICRGHQLINVALGGELVFDIASKFGQGHSPSHELRHLVRSPLDFLVRTNSLHHQAISYTGERLNPKILAINPQDNVIEIIHWEDRFLGVQFHPEFFPDENKNKGKFADFIDKWVKGEVSLVDSEYQTRVKIEPKKTTKVVYEASDIIREFTEREE